jgi:membrane-bound lytic murein transglycosylase D
MERKYFLFLFLTLFFLNCSQQTIKPRVINDIPKENNVSENDLSIQDQMLLEQLKEVEYYYGLGVDANQEVNWKEAQQDFEKALEILSNIDVDEETSSKYADKFNQLLHEISADYKVTLLYLGALSDDASVSAFVERFKDIHNFKNLKEEYKISPLPQVVETTIIYDMPVVWNERVENAITYLQTIARKPFERYLSRSGKYIPLMEKIIKEGRLPHDIVYLPLIESGFNCKAYSWAHAVGPWQFISSTGRLYNLKRNAWYDERRDFVKSTYAACDFLKFLYDKFGDWLLALAAYNGGPGRVERAIQNQNTKDFWKLDLRKQTEDYVPLYLAATIIAKDPQKYGFEVEYEIPVEFDVINLEKTTDLKAIAQALNVSVDTIKELNPELLRGVTPPQIKGYELRIPKGGKDVFVLKQKEMPEQKGYFLHKVKKGETVSAIADKYGVSAFSIIEENNLSKRYRIYAGDYLKIPNYSGESKNETASESASAGKDSVALSDNDITPTVVASQLDDDTIYTVKKGDTLWDIAKKFKTTPQQIAEANGLNRKNYLETGQKLKISSEENKSRNFAQLLIYHIVRSGETLWNIATFYGVPVESILRWNSISDPSYLKVGEKIKVYLKSPE